MELEIVLELKNMLRLGDIEDVYKRVKRRSNRI